MEREAATVNTKFLLYIVLLAASAPALACGPAPAPKPVAMLAADAHADGERVRAYLGDHDKLVVARLKAPGFVRGAALEQELTPEAREKATALLVESSRLLSNGGASQAEQARHKAKQALAVVGVHEFAVILGCRVPRKTSASLRGQ